MTVNFHIKAELEKGNISAEKAVSNVVYIIILPLFKGLLRDKQPKGETISFDKTASISNEDRLALNAFIDTKIQKINKENKA